MTKEFKSKYGEKITGRPIGNLWLEEHEARIATLENKIIELENRLNETDRYRQIPNGLSPYMLQALHNQG